MFWVSSDKYPEVKLLGSSLSPVIAFVLKSILSGVNTATRFFVCFHFHEKSSSISLLSFCVCLLI